MARTLIDNLFSQVSIPLSDVRPLTQVDKAMPARTLFTATTKTRPTIPEQRLFNERALLFEQLSQRAPTSQQTSTNFLTNIINRILSESGITLDQLANLVSPKEFGIAERNPIFLRSILNRLFNPEGFLESLRQLREARRQARQVVSEPIRRIAREFFPTLGG